jgi:osmotically-inducible protein OsmY
MASLRWPVFVPSYSDRLEAEAAATRVAGVLAVANDLEVRLPAIDQRPDPDIARDVVAALKAELPLPMTESRSSSRMAG